MVNPSATDAIRARSSAIKLKHPGERRSLSRSATRALDVLEYFGDCRRPLRAVEISRTLDVCSSTAAQLLKTMVDSGHLAFDAKTKTYLPSPRLAAFSGWAVETYGTDDRLRNLVRELQSATGMVVTLTTPNDLFMQVVEIARPDGREVDRGLQISLFGSVVGSAYLSSLTEMDVARLAARARISIEQTSEIAEALGSIRETGFAHGSNATMTRWSIATSLPSRELQVPLVLGIGASNEAKYQTADIYKMMREVISRRLQEPYKAE